MRISILSFFLCLSFYANAQQLPKLKKNISIKQKDVNASEFSDSNSVKLFTKKNITLANKKGKQPLFILDGKVISKEKVKSIQSKSISKINVLKNEKAINKYGKKGKNGVIEIFLKKE